jgi:hypothetical protein
MSFDSSRFTFNPWNDFLGVVMQQGRVQLDSDWNEWLAEFARRMQAGSMDTMGRAVVPATTANGFKINATVDAGGQQHLTIGAGRMYVDGLMVENHGPAASALWDAALAEMSGAPAAPPSVAEIDLDYTAQPYLPNASLPKGPGPYLAYLDVWKRPVTYLEHPELIDAAVGVDTTGRVQMVWQVKLLDVSQIAGVTCTSSIPAWDSLIQPSGAQLTTAVVPSATSGPCCLNTATGYTGMENQLYRVEIHQGGAANSSGTSSPMGATFKWSRDDASVITAVTAINPATNVANNPTSQLTVQSTGRDNVLSFKPGDWIEITDDFLELNGQAGELHQIDSNGVSKALKTIRLQAPVSSDFQARLTSGTDYHTRICRWDQNGKVYESDGVTVWVDLGAAGSTGQIPVPAPGTSLILENGVTVTFGLNAALGNFKVGDFWAFAARASDGTVQILTQSPPMGIHHHYARLSIVTFPTTATDCRTIWPPTVSAGGDCACTVCVDATDHNAGTATIAMAVEKIRASGGGRICLGPGVFLLRSTLILEGVELLVLSGQGPATSLVFAGDGPAIAAQSDLGLRIEDLNVFAIATAPIDNTGFTEASGAPIAIGIMLRNCVETAIERCAVYAISAASANAVAATGATFAPSAAATPSLGSIAIALDGFLLETLIRDNLLSADIGISEAGLIASLRDARSVMVLIDLEVASNFFPCNLGGVAFIEIGAASKTPEQLNLFLLEIAFRENRLIGCSLIGIGVQGVSLPDAAIRISDNHVDVSGIGIACGADGAEIADNLVTQAMSAAAGVITAPSVMGISISSIPGGVLPITEARILRNRINNYAGIGISVSGLVLISSIAGNSIMNVTGTGIAFAGPQVPSEVMIRDNEVFNVVQPAAAAGAAAPTFGATTSGANLGQESSLSLEYVRSAVAPVTGIQVATAATATIENNTVALIGNSGSGLDAIGISAANAAAATISGNDISDIGPLAGGAGVGVIADTVATANISNNVIRQTTSGSTERIPFRGILISETAASLDQLAGEALVNGNMVYGNFADLIAARTGHCVLGGNLCKQAAQFASDTAAVVTVAALTCIASNNRVLSAGKIVGISITVPGEKDLAKATVVGNIAAISIHLNGAALPAPWAPLNLIA